MSPQPQPQVPPPAAIPAQDKRRRADYRYATPETWAVVRRLYLEGWSAPRLAEQFELTRYAIRARIRREGWTKRSVAIQRGLTDVGLGHMERGAGTGSGAPAPTVRQAATSALNEAARLAAMGKLESAKTAANLADLLARVCERVEAIAPKPPEDIEALRARVRAKIIALAQAQPDGDDD